MSGYGFVDGPLREAQSCEDCDVVVASLCYPCAQKRAAEAAAEARTERDRLAAEVARLEAEAGALRKALVAWEGANPVNAAHRDLINTRRVAALSGEAGKHALAQIEAGRVLAEAAYKLTHTILNPERYFERLVEALAAWDRATAGEGGAK